MFFCRKYKTAVICRIRVMGVPLKRKAFLLRTLHADVPTLSLLIAHNSLPKNLFLLFFCRKIHKTVHKNAKNSPKNRLVHPRTIAPPY